MTCGTIISLCDVIRFCTGSKFVMPSMRKKGTIQFVYPEKEDFGKRVTIQYTIHNNISSYRKILWF